MNKELKESKPNSEVLEQVMVNNDLSRLSPEHRIAYYKGVCESMGLNPLTKPLDYIRLNNKVSLYALKACTDQLRKIHNISIIIKSREINNGVCEVIAQARFPDGRCDEDSGCVNIAGLKGDSYANALMKCITKAKRRATLSIVGLGMLDESELDTIKNKERFDPNSPKEEKKTTEVKTKPLPNVTSSVQTPMSGEIKSKELPYKMTKLDSQIIEIISGLTNKFKDNKRFDEIKKHLKFQTSKDIYVLEDSKKDIFLRELELLKDAFEREQEKGEVIMTTDDLPF